MTLTNYSPCSATQGKSHWPPPWVTDSIDEPGTRQEDGVWYDNPQRASLARVEQAYALGKDGKAPKSYIHLLDGGIADNLGISEPLRMLATRDTQRSLLGGIDSGRITKLIFVVVNARSFAPSELDQRQATPGELDMLLASINAPIDRTTAGTAAQLRNLLMDEFRQMALGDPAKKARFEALADNTALISVDFDAIVDADCRRKYQAISTTWSLDKRRIDALLKVGGALLGSDPEFERLLRLLGDPARPRLATMEEACQAL